MTWNPYFVQKENNQYFENAINKKMEEFLKPQLPNKQSNNETIKYKKNVKQTSCIPFQMNVPQQSSQTKTLTKVAQQALKPIFGKPKILNTPQELKGSAVWERKDLQNKNEITFEQFIKDQNISKNNSIDQKKTQYKKNTRQYSHVVAGNSNLYFLNNNNNVSAYSTTDKQQICRQFSCSSNRDDNKTESTNIKKYTQLDSQLSDRTIKKHSPLNNLIKHKKNNRCISMGEQQQQTVNLECDDEFNLSIEENITNIVTLDQQIGGFTSEALQSLMLSELEYLPDANYLNRQPQLNWQIRAILFDWMMEVSTEFEMKRETYYLAINYVDKYLSTVSTVKAEVQLVGAACMFMASKMEEIYPARVEDFSRSSNYGYSSEQILDMELRICKALKWHLNPPTQNLWLNFYTSQWDLFIRDNNKKFKQPIECSYVMIRTLMAYIDFAYLDIRTLQYKPRPLLASFMYLVLAIEYKQFNKSQIISEIPKTSRFLIVDQQKPFNKLFSEFVQFSFGFNLVDLLPIIQYSALFFQLELDFKLPTLSNEKIRDNYEDFISFQSHITNQVDCLKSTIRN